MLVAQPIYGALIARLRRDRFIPIVYCFFIANIALFWLLLTLDIAPADVARIFFVWASVFVLFAVSVFWSFMADLFDSEQGKRLFGLIGAGGTAGQLLGSEIADQLARHLGSVNLLVIAAVLLALSVLSAYRLERAAALLRKDDVPAKEMERAGGRVGGNWFSGLMQVFLSPYLAGIAIWVSLLSFAGTFVYFDLQQLISATVPDPDARTQMFARIDLYVGLLSVAVQLFGSGRLIRRFGVAAALAFQPAVFVLGFTVLALFPGLAIVIAFQVVQRAANFAISNLGRQILFTPVSREDKYKTKNVIDVVVYRGSDALYVLIPSALSGIGLGMAAISAVAIPVVLGWTGLALALGRGEARRAAATGQDDVVEGETA